MLSGSDEVYANCMVVDQAGDLKPNCIHGDGASSEVCLSPSSSVPMDKSSSSPSFEENDQFMCLPNEESQRPVKKEENTGLRPTISPSHLYVADSYLPFKTHGFIKDRGQLYADMKRRSSSLDDLEVDNGSGGVLDRSHVHYHPLSSSEAMASSRDGLDLPASLQPKECTVLGIRSRSYSYSSSKGMVGRPRIPRHFAVGDSNGERAYSLPEQSCQQRYGRVSPRARSRSVQGCHPGSPVGRRPSTWALSSRVEAPDFCELVPKTCAKLNPALTTHILQQGFTGTCKVGMGSCLLLGLLSAVGMSKPLQ